MTTTSLRVQPQAAPRPLSFAAPIDRAVIHKTGVGEVFVTDSVRAADDLVLVAGELPQAHAFYNDHAGVTPQLTLLAALEIARQSGYVLGHRHFGAPLDAAYVLRTMQGTLASPLRAAPPTRRVVLRMRVLEQFGHHGVTTGVRVSIDLTACDGRPLATVGLSYSWMARERWQRLRSELRATPVQLPEPRRSLPAALVAPAQVGLQLPANVLLASPRLAADGSSDAELLVDPHHAPIFDHPGDHVSGVALLEGWRQHAVWCAAQQFGVAAAELRAASVDAEFCAVAEFDAPLRSHAVLDATRGIVRVEGRQGELVVGAASFTISD